MNAPLHPLEVLINTHGVTAVAKAAGVTHQAVRKWQANGRLPRTEWTGETSYCAKLVTLGAGAVSRDQLLGPWPAQKAQASNDPTGQQAA